MAFGSDRWVPLLSESHKGITLNDGSPGGIDDDGDVSLDLELSIQESVSLGLTLGPLFG